MTHISQHYNSFSGISYFSIMMIMFPLLLFLIIYSVYLFYCLSCFILIYILRLLNFPEVRITSIKFLSLDISSKWGYPFHCTSYANFHDCYLVNTYHNLLTRKVVYFKFIFFYMLLIPSVAKHWSSLFFPWYRFL